MSIDINFLRSRILDAKSNLDEIREGLTFGDPTYIGVVAAIEILTDALAKAPPELKGAREWTIWTYKDDNGEPVPNWEGPEVEGSIRVREVLPPESPTGWDEAQASLLAAKGVLARESVKSGFQLPEPLAEIARHLHKVEFHLSGATPVSLVSPAPGGLVDALKAAESAMAIAISEDGDISAETVQDALAKALEAIWAQPIPPEAGRT